MAEAECRAVWEALKWAWDKSWRKIVINSDSKKSIEWINGDYPLQGRLRHLIRDCKRLIAKDWEVRICHVYREQNEVADCLAREATMRTVQWKEELRPPKKISALLNDEARGVPNVRRRTEICY